MSVKRWSQKTYACEKLRETTTFVYEKGLARLGRSLCTICVNMCVYVSLHCSHSFVYECVHHWVCLWSFGIGLSLSVDCLWPALSLCALPRGKSWTEAYTQSLKPSQWHSDPGSSRLQLGYISLRGSTQLLSVPDKQGWRWAYFVA